MPENEEVLPEVVVKKANTKEGNVGWDVRLQRKMDRPLQGWVDDDGNEHICGGPETDEEYFARVAAMYDRCEKRWGKENANG